MLNHIHIRDLAIVTSIEVELGNGMTALTGETGAGKSILIDALGLTLGDRADSGMIRESCERAEISSQFDLSDNPQALAWLKENGLDHGNECILRRLLVRNGSSRAYINGSPVPLKSLQELAERLIDIHGQHAHQLLLKPAYQQILLDRHAGLEALVQETTQAHHNWKCCQKELEALERASEERESRLELLRFQLDELRQLDLKPGEFEALEQEHQLLSNAGRLQASCARLGQELYEAEQSAHDRLTHALSELQELSGLDPELAQAAELLEGATIQLQEAATRIRRFGEGVELDPRRLQWLEQRIGDLFDCARKYRCQPSELVDKQQGLEQQLELLEQGDIQLQELRQQQEQLKQAYHKLAHTLRQKRISDAARLEQQVNATLGSLGMSGARLQVAVEPLAEGRTTPQGTDRVELRVSTNPGQTPQPLARIASGGELSRISLAIQIATLECTRVPSLIFDEVDVGIGGGVAEIVGRLLRQIGERHQVLCVTHLPQVASQAHHHIQVSKQADGKGTRISVQPLNETARVEEIARMLGGVKITGQSLAHAREMLQQAASR